MQHIAIFGASGAIGRAFCDCLAIAYPNATIHAIARKPPAFSHPHIVPHQLDFDDELAVAALIKVSALPLRWCSWALHLAALEH